MVSCADEGQRQRVISKRLIERVDIHAIGKLDPHTLRAAAETEDSALVDLARKPTDE